MTQRYLIWNLLTPNPEDAPKLRRMWAELRKQRIYSLDFRRRIAHDYAVAKCAKTVVTPSQARVTARSVWPGE